MPIDASSRDEHDRVRAHVLADLPAEQHLAPLGLGRLALGHDLHLRAVLEVDVAILHEQAAHHALEVALGDVEAAPLVVLEDAHVRLGLEQLERLVGVARGEQDLAELLDEQLGQLAVDRPVEADDAAERRLRIAGERALVGLARRAADRDPARVVVLDDRAGRDAELVDQQAARVQVEHVVEREVLARDLLDHREHVHARADLRVVGGALVRVLAVGEVGHLLVRRHQQRREVLLLLDEPARDRRVVAGGVGERLRGERLARAEREPARRRRSSSCSTAS